MESGPVIQTRIVSSVSSCVNTPGMLHVMTSLSSLALMTQDRNIDYVLSVGELVSSFIVYTLWFLPLEHIRSLIFSHCFYFRNIRYLKDLSFYYLVQIFDFYGFPISRTWSCFVSWGTASSPVSPNICSYFFIDYWVVAVFFGYYSPDCIMVYS